MRGHEAPVRGHEAYNRNFRGRRLTMLTARTAQADVAKTQGWPTIQHRSHAHRFSADLVIAAVGDSTLRDIWSSLVTATGRSTRSKATITGERHNRMTAYLRLPNRMTVAFVFQYIPGVQTDTRHLPPPRCRTPWWTNSSWSRALQAQSAIEWAVPGAPAKSLLIYGGIQQSLPSGRAMRELALGVGSCLPEATLVVKSVHPALVEKDPASGRDSIVGTRTAALRKAELLDAEVAFELTGTRALWWDISSVVQHVGSSAIVGSPMCRCHYNVSINNQLAELALKSSWWPASLK